jgi:hypothetical protein
MVGLVYGIIDLTEGWIRGTVSGWAWAALFGGFAGVLWRHGGLRWTGITVCAVLALVALGAGIIYLTEGFTQGVAPSWAGAALFAVFAVVLWRRGLREHSTSAENAD